ncbi:hypothetical protein [Aliiroseovarius marinus]|uniref:hypothetical protein n=1 Tax=Aliiroseovarius marinus TaxID=2500159 RepID=UPI003D7E090F
MKSAFTIILIAFQSLLISFPAFSQVISVKSGEHPTFSRLVFYVKPQEDLIFDRPEARVLRIRASEELKLSIDQVFDFIPRTRIAAINQLNDEELLLTLACDCSAAYTRLRSGVLVLDIISPGSSNPIETATLVDLPVEPPLKNKTEEKIDAQAARLGLPIAAGLTPPEDSAPPKNDTPSLPKTKATPMAEAPPRMILSEDALVGSLARAASQGLLTPKTTESPLSVSLPPPVHNSVETEKEPLPAIAPKPAASNTNNTHVEIQTSIERAFQQHVQTLTGTSVGGCPDAALFDVASWGEAEQEPLSLSAFRADLYLEFDKPNEEAVLSHIRHLIFLTFGAEAIAVARSFDIKGIELSSLVSLADIVEHGETNTQNGLDNFLHCPSPVSLWATLAAKDLSPDIDKSAVLATLSALPPHLRKRIGPFLADRFIQSDDDATANEIYKIVERAGGENSPEGALLNAKLETRAGNIQPAENMLTEIVSKDDSSSPDALILLINSHIKRDAGIPQTTIDLLEAMAFEHSGTQTGDALDVATARALFHALDFARGYEKLDQIAPSGDEGKMLKANIAQEAAHRLVARSSSEQFLKTLYGRTDWGDLPEETRIRIARRLLALGLVEKVRNLLDKSGTPPNRNSRLLLAEGALAENEPNQALIYLTGLTDDVAQRLRAQSLEAVGERQKAAQIYAEIGDIEQFDRANWLGGDWAVLRESQTAPFESLPVVLKHETPTDAATPATSISDHQSLIQSSTSLRTQIESLLDEVPKP